VSKYKTYFIAFIFLFLIIVFLPNPESQNKPEKKEVVLTAGEKRTIQKETFVGAFKEDDLYNVNAYIQEKDMGAFDQLIEEGKIFFIPKGKKVFIVNEHLFNENIEVRFEGNTTVFWTSRKIFE